jgi:hypothetical protein
MFHIVKYEIWAGLLSKNIQKIQDFLRRYLCAKTVKYLYPVFVALLISKNQYLQIHKNEEKSDTYVFKWVNLCLQGVHLILPPWILDIFSEQVSLILEK